MAKHRSPAYPQADLRTVVELLGKLYPSATRHPLGVEIVAEGWGYKAVSSAAPYVAAAKQFGLLRETREGNNRMLQMTERGIDSADPDADDLARNSAYRNAATSPTIFADMWDRWGDELPPESEIRRYLTRDRDFNPKHVSRVAANYLSTLSFAKLVGGSGEASGEAGKKAADTEVDPPDNGSDPGSPASLVKVGSIVHWTSQGVLQFPEPLPIARVEERGGEQYAYFEALNGYAPVSELSIAESGPIEMLAPLASTPMASPRSGRTIGVEMDDGRAVEQTKLDEGSVYLEWPDELSADSVEEFQDWLIGRINRARRKASLGKVELRERD